MQCGKIHGVALAGAILLLLQALLYMTAREVDTGEGRSAITTDEHKTNPVAGILGIASLVAGISIFSTARRADQPEANDAVR
jgi:hypothetical protein